MSEQKYKHLLQPKDPQDELYKIVDSFLIRSDIKIIAMTLGVRPESVSSVKTGRRKSRKIWDRIIQTVMKRKEEKDSFIKYMNTPITHQKIN